MHFYSTPTTVTIAVEIVKQRQFRTVKGRVEIIIKIYIHIHIYILVEHVHDDGPWKLHNPTP